PPGVSGTGGKRRPPGVSGTGGKRRPPGYRAPAAKGDRRRYRALAVRGDRRGYRAPAAKGDRRGYRAPAAKGDRRRYRETACRTFERIANMSCISSSVQQVPHSRIRELAEIAMSMDGVLRLYFGESNLPTPDYIKQAAVRAMQEGFTFYTENAGLPSTRKALADYYRRIQAVELDPTSEIVVTSS